MDKQCEFRWSDFQISRSPDHPISSLWLWLRPAVTPVLSKSRRPFIGHVETALQRLAGTSQRAFIEETPDQSYAVRHAARRRKPGQGIVWIRRPVAARFRYLNETGTQRERRMPGEVRDSQHLIAKRRHQEQVHL